MFAQAEEASRNSAPAPPKASASTLKGMMSNIFTEAHALATGAVSSSYNNTSTIQSGNSSHDNLLNSAPASTSTTSSPRRNIFQDEDPANAAIRLRQQQIQQLSRPSNGNITRQSVAAGVAAHAPVAPAPTSITFDGPVEQQDTSDTNSPKTGNAGGSELDCLYTGEQTLMSLKEAFLQVSVDRFMPGILYMTNYRAMFVPSASHMTAISTQNPAMHSWLSVPLACIDRMEKQKGAAGPMNSDVTILIRCKDMREHRIAVKSKNGSEYETDRALAVLQAYAFPNKLRFLFAFSHKLMGDNGTQLEQLQPFDMCKEFARQGILDYNTSGHSGEISEALRGSTSFPWRLCHANIAFALCNTYPQVLAMPNSLSDDEIFLVSKFRSGQRLPAMTWGSSKTGATMWRSSQPKAGVSGTCLQDEKMLDIIAKSVMQVKNNKAPILRIVDCRPRASAMANKATGAGYESQTNYPHCRLEFYNIGNIHVMRDSLKSIANIILSPSPSSGDVSFGKAMEDTGWLTHVRLVIKASYDTATFLHHGEPVLVHCSHGWDRTAQVCALGQVFVDSHYRTMEGFKALVEKDWFSFGHAFGMRCGHGMDKATRQEDQISPIFLQFLECMWQIMRQYPQYFEFNARYILTIADHIYSGRFGTFLFSCDEEREEMNALQTPDLWTYLHANRTKFMNPLYVKSEGSFLPPLSRLLRNVVPWSDYFFRWAAAPSLIAPPQEYSQQIYRNGVCVDPDADLLDRTSSNVNSDLEVPSTVSHDGFWEGMWARDRRVKNFALKQVEDLTALLRAKGVAEEDIADCLSGSSKLSAEKNKDTEDTVVPSFVITSDDEIDEQDTTESPTPDDDDNGGKDRKVKSTALEDCGLDI